jgi:thiamine-monophosphate kinase
VDVGERELIRRIRSAVGAPGLTTIVGIGDDAAVYEPPGGYELITCDAFVDGVHFRRDFASYREIGAKCMVANVSDIAAMGGFPTRAVISLAIPELMSTKDVEDLYLGFIDVAKHFSFEIVGGDTVSSKYELSISIALLGAVGRDRVVTRAGAVVGDAILVTGRLGGSEAGLQVLSQGMPRIDAAREAIRRHLRPVPRIAEAQAFLDVATPHAMIDISDGLGSELWHIATESGVGIRLVESAIPIAPCAAELAATLATTPDRLALGSGEEFELVVCIPQSETARTVEHVAAVTGTEVVVVGEVVDASNGCTLVLRDGGEVELPRAGYEHSAQRGSGWGRND